MTKDSKNIRYIQFPLMLLTGLHTGEHTIHDILGYGLVHFALKQDVTNADAIYQLVYDLLRNPHTLPTWVVKASQHPYVCEDVIQEILDPVPGTKEDLLDELENDLFDNEGLEEFAIQNCQLNKINGFFSVTGPDSATRLQRYKKMLSKVEKHEATYGTDSYCSIEKGLFFDLANSPDPIIFSAYAAIRSMEKSGNYTATARVSVVGRMVGGKSKEVTQDLCSNEIIADVFKKYSGRKRFYTLIEKARGRGLIKGKISHRGWKRILVSTKHESDEIAELYSQKLKKRSKIESDKRAHKILDEYYNSLK